MATHPHPSALRLFSPCDALMGYVDSSQAESLRKPCRQRWLNAGTLYSRSIDVPFGPRVSGVAQVQPPAQLPGTRCENSARPFGCETSAGGVCNAGGFLMRFFWGKNTPQHNRKPENMDSVASVATSLIVSLYECYCKELFPAAGMDSPLSAQASA